MCSSGRLEEETDVMRTDSMEFSNANKAFALWSALRVSTTDGIPVSPRGSVSIPGEEGTDELEDYEILTSIRDMAVTHTSTLKHIVTRTR